MIADLKPYPEYRDSGLPWLARIPAHWEVMRNGRLFVQRNESGYSDLPILEVSLKTGVRLRNFDESKRKQVMTDRDKYKRAKRGDIAYNMMRMWQGALGCVPADGLVSPAYVVARPFEGTDPLYFSYLFRTAAYQQEVNNASRGIVSDRNRLYWVGFKQLPSVVPPSEEQAAIVRFLAWAKERLDKAIRAKRKVITLLNEQKQAIIRRAVTRGVDPNVRLKDSGIPWLGEIPGHWYVVPLKQLLFRMDYGTSENARGEGRIRVLTMRHIQDGKVLLPEEGSLQTVPPGLLLEKNDLLFNRTNSPELVGKVGLFTGDAEDAITFASYLVRLRVRSEHNPVWLNFVLNSTSFWSYVRSQALISLHQANLNSKRYGFMVIPSPPTRGEEDNIVEHIQSKVREIERAVAATEREISLLREFRTRLIADVVTGNLDVREFVKLLPEEFDTPVPMDGTEIEIEDQPDEAPEEAEA